MKNKFTFTLFLLVLAVFYVMSDSMLADFALSTALLVGLFLLGQMLYMKKYVEAVVQMSENTVTRGDLIRIPIIVKNSG